PTRVASRNPRLATRVGHETGSQPHWLPVTATPGSPRGVSASAVAIDGIDRPAEDAIMPSRRIGHVPGTALLAARIAAAAAGLGPRGGAPGGRGGGGPGGGGRSPAGRPPACRGGPPPEGAAPACTTGPRCMPSPSPPTAS